MSIASFNTTPLIDYVFDGSSPPYVSSARTNPLQLYGISKRDGELAVLGIEGAHVVILRVPVLYAFALYTFCHHLHIVGHSD